MRRAVARPTGAVFFALLLPSLLLFLSLVDPPLAAAPNRTATTSIAVRVERHAGILLRAGNAIEPTAAGTKRSGALAPFGNGQPRLIVVDDVRSGPAASRDRTRVSVIVFEP